MLPSPGTLGVSGLISSKGNQGVPGGTLLLLVLSAIASGKRPPIEEWGVSSLDLAPAIGGSVSPDKAARELEPGSSPGA